MVSSVKNAPVNVTGIGPQAAPGEAPAGASPPTGTSALQEVSPARQIQATQVVSARARSTTAGLSTPRSASARRAEQRPAGPDPQPGAYRVRVGDTLWGIARRAGVSVDALRGANPQVRGDHLYAGQMVTIPEAGGVPDPPPAVSAEATARAARGGNTNPYLREMQAAARHVGVPEAWASDPNLIALVRHESEFNLRARNRRSSAFGLFQMVRSTWRAYLPERPHGTEDAYWQTVAAFRYIRDVYGNPRNAWQFSQATINRDPSQAPASFRSRARTWIARGYRGY